MACSDQILDRKNTERSHGNSGTGTVAVTAATRVRAAGWKVAVIDHRPFGETCAFARLRPQEEMLIGGADTVDHARRMRGSGVAGDVNTDWQKPMAFKRTFTDPVAEKMEQRYQHKGIDTYHGTARFLSEKTYKSVRLPFSKESTS